MDSYNFKIQNVVSTVKLSHSFNLKDLKSKLDNAQYNKSKFPGLIYRLKSQKLFFFYLTPEKLCAQGVNPSKMHRMPVKSSFKNSSGKE